MKVLQSKEEIKLDKTFQVEVVTLQIDVGPGKRKVTNAEIDRVRKRCISAIPSDNSGLSCTKAIVYAKDHLEKDN